jgi:DNA-binding response OmpR family regulator
MFCGWLVRFCTSRHAAFLPEHEEERSTMTSAAMLEQTSQLVQLDDLTIDLDGHIVTLPDGSTRTLTPLEHDLLSVLIAARGGIVTHEELGKRVWGWPCGYDDCSIRSCIKRLREKLQKPDAILNARCLGYRINLPRQSAGIALRKH